MEIIEITITQHTKVNSPQQQKHYFNMIELSALNKQKKEFEDDDLVCFCFEYTKTDIETDYLANGRSTIMERIALEKKKNGCDCASKNPKGS